MRRRTDTISHFPVVGILKGFDQLQNLVLDQVKEEATGEGDTAVLFCSGSCSSFRRLQRAVQQENSAW